MTTIQAMLGKKEAREIGRNCICFGMRKAARAVTQFYDGFLKPSGLKTTQFTLLTATAALGPVPLSVLADAVVMDRTTLGRNLKPLERDGLIEIVPGDDRRTRLVDLTDRGRRTLADAVGLWERAQQEMVRNLDTDSPKELLAQLGNVVSVLVRRREAGDGAAGTIT